MVSELLRISAVTIYVVFQVFARNTWTTGPRPAAAGHRLYFFLRELLNAQLLHAEDSLHFFALMLI